MTTIAVVGLGYVGLPLAVEFGKTYRTIGFDLSSEKIASYKKHYDPRKWVREGEVTFNKRLEQAFADLNNVNTL